MTDPMDEPISPVSYWRDMQRKMRETQCEHHIRYPDAILACGLPRGHAGPHKMPYGTPEEGQ